MGYRRAHVLALRCEIERQRRRFEARAAARRHRHRDAPGPSRASVVKRSLMRARPSRYLRRRAGGSASVSASFQPKARASIATSSMRRLPASAISAQRNCAMLNATSRRRPQAAQVRSMSICACGSRAAIASRRRREHRGRPLCGSGWSVHRDDAAPEQRLPRGIDPGRQIDQVGANGKPERKPPLLDGELERAALMGGADAQIAGLEGELHRFAAIGARGGRLHPRTEHRLAQVEEHRIACTDAQRHRLVERHAVGRGDQLKRTPNRAGRLAPLPDIQHLAGRQRAHRPSPRRHGEAGLGRLGDAGVALPAFVLELERLDRHPRWRWRRARGSG